MDRPTHLPDYGLRNIPGLAAARVARLRICIKTRAQDVQCGSPVCAPVRAGGVSAHAQ